MSVVIAAKKPIAQVKIEAKGAIHRAGMLGEKHQVIAVVDVSGSMADFFRQGIVDGIVTRVLGLALNLDDNGDVPTYGLDHGVHRLREHVTAANLDTYVNRHLQPLVGGATNYAPTINAVIDDLEKGDPALVLFFTDGENTDAAQAEAAIRRASGVPAFFQFFGIHGGRKPHFEFLERLDTMGGRLIDNAGFSEVNLNTVTDDELYAAMLHEYRDYPRVAQAAGLLDANMKWDGRHHNVSGAPAAAPAKRRSLFGF